MLGGNAWEAYMTPTFERAVAKMLAYAKVHGFDKMNTDWGMATSVKEEVKRRLESDLE
jgi:hypothetical protein